MSVNDRERAEGFRGRNSHAVVLALPSPIDERIDD